LAGSVPADVRLQAGSYKGSVASANNNSGNNKLQSDDGEKYADFI
jgi:hypothetical protein